jgi:hypothetical protein
MKLRIARLVVAFLLLLPSLTPLTIAQTSAQTASALPRLVRFGGTVKDVNGNPMTGVVGITFALYSEKTGGAPLWMETQNATADSNGHYTVLLGSTKPEGLPADLFTSEQARWVGVQVSGQAEQPRVLLVSAPYALKAGDAETIGGLPPSAFVLAAPLAIGSSTSSSTDAAVPPPAATDVTTTGGILNYLPIFSGAATIIDSSVFQTGSGTTGKIGIDTTTPVTQLDVNGAGTVRGTLSLPATGVATAAGGKNSQGLNIVASSFSSTSSTALNQVFRWQAEPAANDTTAPSGTLNLQYGLGTATPTETGLKISSKGLVTFATGQMFPGTGDGSVKSVGLTAPATDFTVSGSPVTGAGTLNFAWKVAPTNADTANAIVKRDGSGNFSAGAINATGLTATGSVTAADLNVLATVTAATVNATTASITGSMGVTSTFEFPLFASSNLGGATAIEGSATATSGDAWGVEGVTASSYSDAYGVYGVANSLTGNPIGVYGWGENSTSAIGVFGQQGSESSTAVNFSSVFSLTNGAAGVWGDGGTTSPSIGVIGTVDNGWAGLFTNNGPGFYTLEAGAQNSSASPFLAFNLANSTQCGVDANANLNCTGTKNAIVPIDGGARIVAMSAIEAPQNWFEDAGSAELVQGVARVTLDPDFIQTVNTEMEYMVFPVPNGDCKGLYVSHQTPTSFEVHELGGGTSNVRFYYRIMALRKKYENVRFADHSHDLDQMKLMQKRLGMKVAPHPHTPNEKLQLAAPRAAPRPTATKSQTR